MSTRNGKKNAHASTAPLIQAGTGALRRVAKTLSEACSGGDKKLCAQLEQHANAGEWSKVKQWLKANGEKQLTKDGQASIKTFEKEYDKWTAAKKKNGKKNKNKNKKRGSSSSRIKGSSRRADSDDDGEGGGSGGSDDEEEGGEKDKEPSVICDPPVAAMNVRFSTIAGLGYEKSQLDLGFIQPITYPQLFKQFSRGILLYGPPGTGKTLLAQAATAEIPNSVLFAPKPGNIKGKFQGETERNIQNIFECTTRYLNENADRYQLAIIFFDEFEAIAGKRGAGDAEMTRTVTTLLQFMEGFGSDPRIAVLAATNFPKDLDDAIMRRFSTRVLVDLPDRMAREFIFRQQLALEYNWPHTAAHLKAVNASDMRRTGGAFLSNLAEYGPKSKRQRVNDDAIQYFVCLTGPNNAAKPMMESRRPGDAEYWDRSAEGDKTPVYGHSPSDITRVIKLAIGQAARRAIHRNAQFLVQVVEGLTYFVYISGSGEGSDASDNREYERGYESKSCNNVADEFGAKFSRSSATKEEKKRGKKKAPPPRGSKASKTRAEATKWKHGDVLWKDEIPSTMRGQVVTFDLQVRDMLDALSKYPPTTQRKTYEDIVKYASNSS